MGEKVKADGSVDAVGSLADIGSKALRLLLEVPLCDRCLGRMFALLGRGLSNAERGRAIKTMLLMAVHRGIREGSEGYRELLEKLAPNMGDVASKLYQEVFGRRLEARSCFICGSKLDSMLEAAAERASQLLREIDVRGFLVAARVDRDVKFREDELKRRFQLGYAESIAAEVRREVSKRIQAVLGLKPDFDKPDVVVVVDVPSGNVELQLMPLLIEGVYWKVSRRVSQSAWITRRGERRYPFSVEDGLFSLAELYDAENVILHASGREDADARMLGTGRPFIVELKKPRKRRVGLDEATATANRYASGLVEYRLVREARRGDVERVKGEVQRRAKLYKALVVVEDGVSDEELRMLEEFFRGRSIRQRTPRRVRHRRPDVVRERVVFEVSTRRISRRVFDAYILAEGGLYIKELVDGDGGDTTPSFAEKLGREAYCAELDVLAVYEL
jgi:tRNA pseudouridine synthase 10